MTQYNTEKLQKIKTFPHLVQYLRDDLEWPIETDDFTELTFEYKPEELGIDPKYAVKIEEIQQLRPLVTGQPWGIFFVKFGKNKLSVVALRKILSQLVIKKRESMRKADQPTWRLHDLLFISNFCEDNKRKITFAKFTQNEETNDLPTLKVLGWDEGDTVLRMEHVQQQLHTSLRWPKDEKKVDDWRLQWSSAFTLGRCEIIRTSQELAVRLADLAGKIRIRALQVIAIESEKGPLRTLHKAFREALIHDLSEEDFADMYAQTIAYGLLAARVSRPMGITADNMADMVPNTNPFLKEMLSVFLTVGGRKSGINFDELGVQDIVDLLNNPGTHMEDVLRDFGNRTQREDPVIYFYELFLKEYDSQKKVERGVFYTPRPVVSYIVRSVHELLQTEFGLDDGLASTITWGEMIKKSLDLKLPVLKPRNPADKDSKDITISPEEPFVTILDPATGTATFLVEVIDIIHNTMIAKWEKEGLKTQQISQKWNEYVPRHLLPRLYGFELMMAPYAIAHMKIGLKLNETGYKFRSDERVRIYLTNSLERSLTATQRELTYFSEALAHESIAVKNIKENSKFTVVIGNPPYSGISANLAQEIREIVNPYRYVDGEKIKEKSALQFEKNLNDDYIKFLRFAEMQIEKQVGIIGFITNNGFLESATLRGLRNHLLHVFNKRWFIDLHGDTDKRERDESGKPDKNVFDIKKGVAISLLLRNKQIIKLDTTVSRFDIKGDETQKNDWLSTNYVFSTSFSTFLTRSPNYYFLYIDPLIHAEYSNGIPIQKIFSINSTGFESGRDEILTDFTPTELMKKLKNFASSDFETLRKTYSIDEAWGKKLFEERKSIVEDQNFSKRIIQFLFEPFDIRYCFYRKDLLKTNSYSAGQYLKPKENIALLVMRQVSIEGDFNHVGVTRLIPNNRCFYSTKGKISYFPLWLYAKGNDIVFNTGKKIGSNFHENTRGKIKNAIANTIDFQENQIQDFEIFNFIYAILNSLTYRQRYKIFLKTNFPNVLLPKTYSLFISLSNLGSELVSLHLVESSKLNQLCTKFIGTIPTCEIEKVAYSDYTVWLDKAKTEGFQGISENIWNFHIGGYQVCEKWLKDRKGRQLSAEDIAHYQKIIVALNETIRIMAEIDEVIEKHGGWPGAFDTSGAGAEAAAGVAEQQTLFGDDPA